MRLYCLIKNRKCEVDIDPVHFCLELCSIFMIIGINMNSIIYNAFDSETALNDVRICSFCFHPLIRSDRRHSDFSFLHSVLHLQFANSNSSEGCIYTSTTMAAQ